MIARDTHPARIAQQLEGCAARARDASRALEEGSVDLDRDAILRVLANDVALLAQATIALAHVTARAADEAGSARPTGRGPW